jgi:hypothetical protein
MSRLYACIISVDAKRDRAILLSVAQQFSNSIELLEDGILFNVSGLQNLIGDADKISRKILEELRKNSISGTIAVAKTTDTATLLARGNAETEGGSGVLQGTRVISSPDTFAQLPLENLLIDDDTLNVFRDLGIKSIQDLRRIPKDELIDRYGQHFKNVLDVIEQQAGHLLTPNVKENHVSWDYQLDSPVEDFEQLIFILNHGLDRLLTQTERYGFSTEQLDIFFKLQNKTERTYEIKTSFPTLEKTFWLKLINLRISLDPPQSEIAAIQVTSHFTPPRPAQRGLYAVSRPDPERLLLTVNKLKNLVGEENVGVPVLLDQRVEKAFELDAEAMPKGKEVIHPIGDAKRNLKRSVPKQSRRPRRSAPKQSGKIRHAENTFPVVGPRDADQQNFPEGHSLSGKDSSNRATIAFSYFNPPIPADVLIRDKKLVFLRTQYFSGHVKKYSGVWKTNSKWWDESWKAQEWDVEIENHGVYRLCKVDKDWFLAGEYD